MEDLIKRFLTIELLCDGYGDGYGDGSGYGDGYGDGDGSGYGDGYGYGDGSGSGDGDGSGYGDGYGSGSGYGDGSKLHSVICEHVNAKEYRKGFIDKQIATLKRFNRNDVYYVDNIPCYFLAIKENLAKVKIIKDDFTTEVRYIAKQGNLFAHGVTKEEALQSVLDKHFASLSFTEKKAEFIKKFKNNDKHKASVFFDWHHILTGSCKSGRLDFIQSKGISLESEMTVFEFLQVTQNEYKGSIIKEILSEIN